MQDIELRAWDEKQQYMAYQGTPDLENIQSFIFHFGDKILMQYIGLKDFNNKKIYVGDIICGFKPQYQTWYWRGIVKFSHGTFGVEWFRNIESQCMVGSWGQSHNLSSFLLEEDRLKHEIIIGNIYATPELLKQI